MLAVVCVGVLAFYIWTARQEGQSWNFGQRQTDYYNLLAEGFLDGHLYMNVEVPPELLKLADPYNPANRPPGMALHDASMYRGHYYLYFGAAPVVTLMVPFRLLTGTPLPLPAAVIFFTWGGFLASVALLSAIRSRYFPESGTVLFLLGVVALGTAGMGPLIVLRSSIWELPLSGGYFYAMLAAYLLYRSLHSPQRAAWWFAGVGLSLGLAVASRPTYLYTSGLVGVPLLWWFWQAWRDRRVGQGVRWPWRIALAGLVPLGVVGLAMAVYNYARFGSFTEFGVAYQFSGIFEAETQHFRWSYFPLNWRMYLTQPAEWSWYFPFIHRAPPPPIPAGHLGFDDLYGALVNAPLVWCALLAPLAFWRRANETWQPLRVLLITLACMVAGTLGTLLFFYAAMARYGADFMPASLLLAMVGVLALERWVVKTGGRGLRRVLRPAAGALALCSIFYAVVLSFEAYGNLRRLSPGTYSRLGTWLNLPSQWRETFSGVRHGPLELELHLPTGRPPVGTREALVSTGFYDTGDHVFVQYEENRQIRLGYVHDGSPEVLSRPLTVTDAAAHRVRVEMGSLYPPEEHPFFAEMPAAERSRLARRLSVWWDDEVVLDRYQRFNVSAAADVTIARTQFGAANLRRFTGEFGGARRIGGTAALRKDAVPRQVLRLRLGETAGTTAQPIATVHDGEAGAVWYLQRSSPGALRVGYAGQKKTLWESAPIVTDANAVHEIEFCPVVDSNGRQSTAVKWDGTIVATCPNAAMRGRFRPGVDGIGTPLVEEKFDGTLQAMNDGSGIDRFDTVKLVVTFPVGRRDGREPLVVAGETGRGDFVFVEYLENGRMRFGLDHWGKPSVFGPPMEIDLSAPHTVAISLESFPGARLPGAVGEPRRLRIVLDGRVVWEREARLYTVSAEDVFVGRNPIGGTAGEPPFTGTILEVQRVLGVAEWRKP